MASRVLWKPLSSMYLHAIEPWTTGPEEAGQPEMSRPSTPTLNTSLQLKDAVEGVFQVHQITRPYASPFCKANRFAWGFVSVSA